MNIRFGTMIVKPKWPLLTEHMFDLGKCKLKKLHQGGTIRVETGVEYVISNTKDKIIKPVMVGINKIFEHKLADIVSLPTTALMHGQTIRSAMANACTWPSPAVCDGTIPGGTEVYIDKFKNIIIH